MSHSCISLRQNHIQHVDGTLQACKTHLKLSQALSLFRGELFVPLPLLSNSLLQLLTPGSQPIDSDSHTSLSLFKLRQRYGAVNVLAVGEWTILHHSIFSSFFDLRRRKKKELLLLVDNKDLVV
jgi:hypothetical protein